MINRVGLRPDTALPRNWDADLPERFDHEWEEQRDKTPEPGDPPFIDHCNKDAQHRGSPSQPSVPRWSATPASAPYSKWGRCRVHPQCMMLPHHVKKTGQLKLYCRRYSETFDMKRFAELPIFLRQACKALPASCSKTRQAESYGPCASSGKSESQMGPHPYQVKLA